MRCAGEGRPGEQRFLTDLRPFGRAGAFKVMNDPLTGRSLAAPVRPTFAIPLNDEIRKAKGSRFEQTTCRADRSADRPFPDPPFPGPASLADFL